MASRAYLFIWSLHGRTEVVASTNLIHAEPKLPYSSINGPEKKLMIVSLSIAIHLTLNLQ